MHAHPEFFAAVCLQVVLLLALAAALGRLVPLRGFPAMGWGAYALFSATYLSYEICFTFAVPLAGFPLLTGGFLAILVAVLRRCLPPRPATPAPIGWLPLLAAAGLALPLLWVRTLNGFSPNASAQFFQAWDPLFLRASVANGRFLGIEAMGFGEGFLTSALLYAPNTRGLSTLLALGGSSDLYASYVAAGSFSLVAGLWLLLDALKQSRPAVALFTFLFLAFAAGYQPLTNHIFGASSDELLFFAAALAAHSLFATPGLDRPEKWAVAFAALALGVSGRNYGAFFAILLLLPLAVTVWRRSTALRELAPSVALGSVLMMPEVLRLCTAATLFYPRTRLPELFPWSLERFGWGSLCDWGLLYEQAPGSYAPSLLGLYIVILGLVSGQLWRMHRTDLLPSLAAPLLFLAMPLLLELASGFRKDIAYSKIYFGSCWIFAWLPAYALLRLANVAPLAGCRPPISAARWLVAATVAGVSLVILQGYGKGYYRILSAAEFQAKITRWWEADSSGIDESIARKALAWSGARGTDLLAGRRVMYFHYEPGIGLRWFLGGDFFADLDFWSLAVQQRLNPEMGVAEFLDKFDRPVLYLSLGPKPHYQGHVTYPHQAKLWRELQDWRMLDCFSHVIEQDGALLLIPR